MRTGRRISLASTFTMLYGAPAGLSGVGLSSIANAQSVTALCTPKILANQELVTAAQREAAGDIAQPPLTDAADGFAWPDTPLGVIKTDSGYAFFGSDEGQHTRSSGRGTGTEIISMDLSPARSVRWTTRSAPILPWM